MNKLYILPFFLFLIASWFYYKGKMNRQKALLSSKREEYIRSRPDLPEDQKINLEKGEPWPDMPVDLLVELFGEPMRKRVLDQSVTRFIWSYGDLFVYVSGDRVAEWKKR